MTFTVEERYLEEMIAHVRAEYPNEGCGIIAGVGRKITKLYRTRNAEESAVRYLIDPREQLDIMREMDEQGWQLLGIFHSHTHSPAYPSATDIQLAYYRETIYFIVSLMDSAPEVRAFLILDGKVKEIELVVKPDFDCCREGRMAQWPIVCWIASKVAYLGWRLAMRSADRSNS